MASSVTRYTSDERRDTISAFTLVEILIVVAILGILAAAVVPSIQGHIQKSKESNAKENLYLLRSAIGRYAIEHNDIPPGYPNGDTKNQVSTWIASAQLTMKTNSSGQLISSGANNCILGPYLQKIPENPFNELATIKMINNNEDFPDSADGDFGWIYQPATKTIRLDWPGVNSAGVPYYDY